MGNTGTRVTFSVFITEFYTLMWDMRWLMLLAFVLILVDLWYGVSKSRRRGEEVRMSRAIRRTLLKIGDYVCVILLGAVLGKALGQPLGIEIHTVAVCCMLLACYCELESVISNFCECKGIHYHFSLWHVIKGVVSMKSDTLRQMMDEVEQENKKEESK